MPRSAFRNVEQVNAALFACEPKIRRGALKEIERVAQTIDRDAEALARARIRRIGFAWSQMRIGRTSGSVYLAPVQRGTKRGRQKRPNLAPLLLDRAMRPAVRRNEAKVLAAANKAISDTTREFNRGRP